MLTLCCVKLGCEVFWCFITSDALLPIGSMELVYIYIYIFLLFTYINGSPNNYSQAFFANDIP